MIYVDDIFTVKANWDALSQLSIKSALDGQANWSKTMHLKYYKKDISGFSSEFIKMLFALIKIHMNEI